MVLSVVTWQNLVEAGMKVVTEDRYQEDKASCTVTSVAIIIAYFYWGVYNVAYGDTLQNHSPNLILKRE
jgi:hypothetical protein